MKRALVGLLLLLAVVPAACGQETHPLPAYVQAPDAAYSWSKASEMTLPFGTATQYSMTSQVWHGITWQHNLWVVKPQKMRANPAVLLLVTGGKGDKPWNEAMMVATLAAQQGIPFAVLFGIPNQPLFDGKKEDALIAYTFVQAIQTGDMTWPLLFPMVKSAVRAMDTVRKVAETEWKTPLKGFVVTGASKRGWTSWLTGAADPRVLGIVPMVYDNLNLQAQMRQQMACYGGYSDQIRDYTELGIQGVMETPRGRELVSAVDPYALRSRLALPKLSINGTNDRYWTLEAANLYFPGLPGEKHILYIPNAGHGLGDFMDVVNATLAQTRACEEGRKLPTLDWTYREEKDGLRLTVKPGETPVKVAFWTAEAPTCDFRDARWTEQTATGNGFTLSRPQQGYRALFGQVRFRVGDLEFPLSTTPKMIGAK
ncbi:MAG TPA: PhoPQ-activated protein PqaA family protein [Chloroflexota bacterium]|nr:PhoPQ-activated protein PqaA family protein [Chloroflexota bacterium]